MTPSKNNKSLTIRRTPMDYIVTRKSDISSLLGTIGFIAFHTATIGCILTLAISSFIFVNKGSNKTIVEKDKQELIINQSNSINDKNKEIK